MSIVTADDYKRVRIPDAKPGQSFEYQLSGNVVKLTPVKAVEEDVPVVKMIRHPDCTCSFPDGVKISREEIRAAIRADRDSR